MPESSAAVKHRANNFYSRTPPSLPSCKTELDILIERHQFIRDSEEQNLSWEDALARKTYDQLFKELAVCDLSRWKEGKVAMRWRTASEVIDGKGHFTCSNLRCKYHEPSKLDHIEPGGMAPIQCNRIIPKSAFEEQESFIPLDSSINQEFTRHTGTPSLSTKLKQHLQELQTSFGYLEHGERKVAQVKLKLCKKCVKKMNSCSISRKSQTRSNEDGAHSTVIPSSKKRELAQSRENSTHVIGKHNTRPAKLRRTSAR